jgi:TolA-binding protein
MKLSVLFAGVAALALTLPAAAQDPNVEGRVVKLEKEMKAVQRKVFPDGAGKYFEPEIKADETGKTPDKAASGTAVSDLIARVDALETQLATLTNDVEQHGNSMKTMEDRLKALEAQVKSMAASQTALATEGPKAETPAIAAAKPVPATKPAVKPLPAAVSKDKAREAAVAKIEKPQTGDAFEDAYNYGYRLWEAKYYPEAQTQLDDTVKKYPNHKRVSFARNLLGRAWLDDGRPSQAAKILYDNYQADKTSERAPDSLFYLGVALTELDKPADACGVFKQLAKAHPEVATGRLAGKVDAARKKAKCT